jgi:deoxyribose-phosphate aldolase
MKHHEVVQKVTEEVYKQMGASASRAGVGGNPELAGHIEHSILNPIDAREDHQGMRSGKAIQVCQRLRHAIFRREGGGALKSCNVGICAPVGFPQGAASTCGETLRNQGVRGKRRNGAGRGAEHRRHQVRRVRRGQARIKAMVDAAGFGVKVKAIYEQGLLTDDEKKKTLEIIRDVAPLCQDIQRADRKAACKDDVAFVKGIVGDSRQDQD